MVDICLVVLKLGISELLFSDYKWTPFYLLLVTDFYPGMVVKASVISFIFLLVFLFICSLHY